MDKYIATWRQGETTGEIEYSSICRAGTLRNITNARDTLNRVYGRQAKGMTITGCRPK